MSQLFCFLALFFISNVICNLFTVPFSCVLSYFPPTGRKEPALKFCRLLGCGWKLSVDEKCNKCLMPMMQKKPENISKCAACEIKNFQSNGNRYQSSQESQLGSSYIKSPLLSSALSASSKSSTQSTYSTSLSNLGIGKKLLENWSLVTSRTCECGRL